MSQGAPRNSARLRTPARAAPPGFGLARALSKLGFCSRSQAWDLIRAARVRVNGAVVRDGEFRTRPERDRIEVDGARVGEVGGVYLLLNKPRGLLTTAADEHGRDTVYACLAGADLPFLSPVGRLDQASEGLLLLTNDTAWAAGITDPSARIEKTYHVQVNCLADAELCRRLEVGVTDSGELLRVRWASLLRAGGRNSWIAIVLDEGRNRHIRRSLAALGLETLRLVRVAIGSLELGELAKGRWRHLSPEEVAMFRMTSSRRP